MCLAWLLRWLKYTLVFWIESWGDEMSLGVKFLDYCGEGRMLNGVDRDHYYNILTGRIREFWPQLSNYESGKNYKIFWTLKIAAHYLLLLCLNMDFEDNALTTSQICKPWPPRVASHMKRRRCRVRFLTFLRGVGGEDVSFKCKV